MRVARSYIACLLATLLLGACGDEPSPELTAAREADVPASYNFVLKSTCGERPLVGTYHVVVVDGEVTAAHRLGSRGPADPDLAQVPTLTDLVHKAGSSDAERVDLKVDDQGLPVSLTIDPDGGADDDEECYAVRDLQETGAAPG